MLSIITSILFLYFLIEVLYLLALSSVSKSNIFDYSADKKYHYAVLIPKGYNFVLQDYQQEYYNVFEYTNNWLTVIKQLDNNLYEEALILGDYTSIPTNLLSILNIANNQGYKAIQLHTVLKDSNTFCLKQKTRFEELRNALFKSGRCGWGFSSTMDKENFIIPVKWTQDNIKNEHTNLEMKLINHKIFIKYISEPYIISTHFPQHNKTSYHPSKIINRIKRDINNRNFERFERDVAFFFPSPINLSIILTIFSIIQTLISPSDSIQWWILLYFTLFIFSLALPDYVIDFHKEKKNRLKKRTSLWIKFH